MLESGQNQDGLSTSIRQQVINWKLLCDTMKGKEQRKETQRNKKMERKRNKEVTKPVKDREEKELENPNKTKESSAK